jgi:hypothetical protein
VNALGSLVYFGILGHIGFEVRALDMTAAKGVNSTHTYLPSAKPCRIARRAFESRYLKAVSTTKVSQRLKRKALGAVNAAAQLNISGDGLFVVMDTCPASDPDAPGGEMVFAPDAPGGAMAEIGK